VWYAIAALVVATLGAGAWLAVRAYDAGQTKQAEKAWRAGAVKRREADEVMAEPVADEGGWLAAARRRLHRMQDDPDA
jgi:hypothetical protein